MVTSSAHGRDAAAAAGFWDSKTESWLLHQAAARMPVKMTRRCGFVSRRGNERGASLRPPRCRRRPLLRPAAASGDRNELEAGGISVGRHDDLGAGEVDVHVVLLERHIVVQPVV